jgi:hypothetical protein
MTKLCSECKWCERPGEFARCICPKNYDKQENEATRYTGFTYKNRDARWIFCETQRRHGMLAAWSLNQCGKNGRWWEPK